ncbi:MAG: aminopeptidase P family protein [Christensenellales bacterium]|jgi:Xaa-Pro aminopeptidase
MNKRVRRLFESGIGAETVCITKSVNMRYYSGFTGEGVLVLTPDDMRIVTDSRYGEQAFSQAPQAQVTLIGAGDDYLGTLARLLKRPGIERAALEDKHITAADFFRLRDALPGDFIMLPLGDAADGVRAVKDGGEITAIAKAQKLADEAFSRILSFIRPGVTETDVALELEMSMRRAGAQGLSFDMIVASGIHSAMPHATLSGKKIEPGDVVTLDFGCRVDGYCSDMTRTVAVGYLPDELKKIYGVVLEAQLAALEVLATGKTGRQVDAAARRIIESAGYGEYFGHGLGHGVGLEIHEMPRLSHAPEADAVLQKGHVVTVEPGVYVPALGGVRIEDLCVLTENGYNNLTSSDKKLMII